VVCESEKGRVRKHPHQSVPEGSVCGGVRVVDGGGGVSEVEVKGRS
jgi:hypothetical protein